MVLPFGPVGKVVVVVVGVVGIVASVTIASTIDPQSCSLQHPSFDEKRYAA